jgi:ATP-dependent RNA helicase DHX37/DHR1
LKEASKHVSKRHRIKLERMAEAEKKSKHREELFSTLQGTMLPVSEQQLMKSSRNMSRHETVKEKVRRQDLFEKAGLAGVINDADLPTESQTARLGANPDGTYGRGKDMNNRDVKIAAPSAPVVPSSENLQKLVTVAVDVSSLPKKKKEKKKKKRFSLLKNVRGDISSSSSEDDMHGVNIPNDTDDDDDLDKLSQPADDAEGSDNINSASDAAVSEGESENDEQEEVDEEEIARIIRAEAERKEAENYVSSARLLRKDNDNASSKKEEEANKLPLRDGVVLVKRTAKIVEERSHLPVIGEEQPIMEAIRANPVVLICGATGSGKTTQIPQFLYEAGYASGGLIGCCQPRRVAAISVAHRVADELNTPIGDLVGYQVRYEKKYSAATRLKFMTDGVLLKEAQKDFLLSAYSVIILDEAHERGVNTDILLGLLSRIIPLREQLRFEGKDIPSLKLVVMSATLRVADFTENRKLFHQRPPVMEIPARQYPVTVHFSRRTELINYVEVAYQKIMRIHQELPPGDILVFLSGRQDIRQCMHLLQQRNSQLVRQQKIEERALAKKNQSQLQPAADSDSEAGIDCFPSSSDEEGDGGDDIFLNNEDKDKEESDSDRDSDMLSDQSDDDENVQVIPGTMGPSEAEQAATLASQEELPRFLEILPLYSALSTAQQMKIYAKPPAGYRRIVVATNVAETSITIPNVRYVVDAGREKSKNYDLRTGIASFDVDWISQASADQRMGRAGRTSPGHCYRLYSSAVYSNDFPPFAAPVITRVPLEDVVLDLKALHVDHVTGFPFVSPPSSTALVTAEVLLLALGALMVPTHTLTPKGRQMASLPIAPRVAALLLRARKLDAAAASYKNSSSSSSSSSSSTKHSKNEQPWLSLAVPMACLLSVSTPLFLRESLDHDNEDEDEDEDAEVVDENEKEGGEEKEKRTMSPFAVTASDMLGGIFALGAFLHTPPSGQANFCQQHLLSLKAAGECQKLGPLLWKIMGLAMLEASPPQGKAALAQMTRLLLAAYPDQIAKKLTPQEIPEGLPRSIPIYMTASGQYARIHPTSFVQSRNPPAYIVYGSILAAGERQQEKSERTGQKLLHYLCQCHAVPQEMIGEECVTCLTHPIKIMENPPPIYEKDGDFVRAFYAPVYQGTPHSALSAAAVYWPLPKYSSACVDGSWTAKAMSIALLDGSLFPKTLGIYADHLLQQASVIRRGVTTSRVVALLRSMESQRINNREDLKDVWAKNPNFLVAEYLAWLPKEYHSKIMRQWPPQV